MEWIMEWVMENLAAVLWLFAALVLLITETATVQMVCIWFAIGAFVTAIGAMFGMPGWGQFILFVASSGVSLLLTQKFVKNVLHIQKTPTNADSVIGLSGTVTEEVDNTAETGRVRVAGLDWMARSLHHEKKITVGDTVTVTAIQGVKVIVQPRE